MLGRSTRSSHADSEAAPEDGEEEKAEGGSAGTALCFFSGGELPESVEEEEEEAAEPTLHASLQRGGRGRRSSQRDSIAYGN